MTDSFNPEHTVLRFGEITNTELTDLIARYQLEIKITPLLQGIPGSFWGDDEAGLIGNQLHLREDTPVHSALHEACHYICIDDDRRQQLHTNAGNYQHEENAACYLQILLADELSSMGRQRMLSDMDAWGYSFRLGSSQAWFEQDAEEARDWLLEHALIDPRNNPKYRLR